MASVPALALSLDWCAHHSLTPLPPPSSLLLASPFLVRLRGMRLQNGPIELQRDCGKKALQA